MEVPEDVGDHFLIPAPTQRFVPLDGTYRYEDDPSMVPPARDVRAYRFVGERFGTALGRYLAVYQEVGNLSGNWK